MSTRGLVNDLAVYREYIHFKRFSRRLNATNGVSGMSLYLELLFVTFCVNLLSLFPCKVLFFFDELVDVLFANAYRPSGNGGTS